MAIPEHIIISENLDKLSQLISGRRVFAIVDNNLRYLPIIKKFGDKVLFIDASEDLKTMNAIEMFAISLLERGVDRDYMLVGIGGGITTDIAGFLAAIYMRGIACGLVPTTLLSQIDAAIGGKNGVNVNHYKNILGTIRKPEFVYICPALSQATPTEVNLCGVAEMLKTFILKDPEYYQRAVDHYSGKKNYYVMDLIRRTVEIQCEISESDPLEKGNRHLLNLGHTFGHAIEKCGELSMPHGLAVAVGMVIASKMSVKLGLMKQEVCDRIENDFKMLHLPTHTLVPTHELMRAIRKDKKKIGNTICFVLPVDIGNTIIRPLTFDEIENLISDI